MTRLVRYILPAVLAVAPALFPTSLCAQSKLPLKMTPKPTTAAITAADAMSRLYVFADDSMMGRRTGEEGGLKGTAYIEREVRRLGLTPGGDNGTFFQAVPMYTRTLDATSAITADTEPVVIGTDYYPLSAVGVVRPIDGVQVIFAGNPGDSAASITPEQAAGKIVFVAGGTAIAARRYPAAAGFMTVIPEPQINQFRAFATSPSTRLRSDTDTARTRFTFGVFPSAVRKFLGVPLENARPGTLGRTLHGTIRYNVTDAPARNVVAILRGSDAKLHGEYVAMGAHSDHLGRRRAGPLDHDSLKVFNETADRIYMARTHQPSGFPGSGLTPEERASIRVNTDSLRKIRPARLDSIYNGADDDGSGSVGVLEIAERFARSATKPKRSIVFVWHTGEELGLYGSEWFTDHPTISRDSIVAQLNMDMIGRGEAADWPGGNPNFLQLIGSRRLSTELGDIVESVNKSGKHGFAFDYSFDANGHPERIYCRSDHYEYARYGIPITFFTTAGHSDYHQLTDEAEYINYPHLARVASLVADIGNHIANLDHRIAVDKPKPDPKGECVQ
ncbi:MAG: M28 family peptidase [Gemmatimonadaceae bacterium]